MLLKVIIIYSKNKTSVLYTVFAKSVEYGSYRIKLETVILEKMLLYFLQFIAVKMNKLSALLAFAVIAYFPCIVMMIITYIFKTCRTVSVDNVFINYSFIHKTFELTIDG